VDRQLIREDTLLLRATEKLAETTGLKLEIIRQEYQVPTNRRIDALARIPGAADPEPYAIEVKRHLTKATAGLAIQQLKTTPYKGILVTEYVNPNMAERLQKMGIPFIDTVGNAYINEPPIYVYIKGNKPATHGWKERIQTRTFRPTGLQVLFALLCDPDLLQAPYRDIADATDVALGTVGWVLTDLKTLGFLIEENKVRRLVRKPELFDRWVAAYPLKFRPKLELGRYQAPNPDWWQTVTIAQYGAVWGGEVAAAKLTNYLRPAIATIYATEIPPRLILDRQLKKDPNGNVELLQRFWRPDILPAPNDLQKVELQYLAPPLLIYADLIATAEPRNLETARLIYDEFLN
jgi:hypothetical protein